MCHKSEVSYRAYNREHKTRDIMQDQTSTEANEAMLVKDQRNYMGDEEGSKSLQVIGR